MIQPVSELIPLFQQFGVWISVLIVVAYFLLRHVWPYWKAKAEREETAQQKIVERLQNLTEVSITELTRTLGNTNAISAKIVDHLEELTNEIRDHHAK